MRINPRLLRALLPLVAAATLLAPAAPAPAEAATLAPQAATLAPQAAPTDRLIVLLHPASTLTAQVASSPEQVADRLGGEAGTDLDYVRPLGADAHILSLEAPLPAAEVEALAWKLSGSPDVALAMPDAILFPAREPGDNGYEAYAWHLKGAGPDSYGANLPAAWEITTGNPVLPIAVIDTGGLLDHEDLAGRSSPGNPGYDMISDTSRSGDGDGRDGNPRDMGDYVTQAEASGGGPLAGCRISSSSWHGSHVAGTIGASANNGRGMAGINWSSPLLYVRALGKCGGYISDIVDGLRWAAGLPVLGLPTNPTPARVLNLSLGGAGSCSPFFQQAVDDVTAAGAVVVVAAGNENRSAANSQPGNCSGVITVAATASNGNRASYSNYGSLVEIAAPGGDTSIDSAIYSVLNSGAQGPQSDSYGFYQGTSMATPHVAGIASLMLSVNPGLSPAEIVELIQTTSTPFPDGSSCWGACGAGIVNAGAAVEEAARRVRSASFQSDSTAAVEGGSVSVPLSLSLPSNQSVTLPYSLSGSAGPGDHRLTAGQVTFAPGATTTSLTFDIVDDDSSETPETLVISLGPAAQTGLGALTTHTVTIRDNDAQPSLSFNPASLSFGAQRVGAPGGAQTISIRNGGGGPLSIQQISLSGDFTRSGGSCPTSLPATLAPGASCTVGISFSPGATGARTGALNVASNAEGGPHSATLSGTGIAPAAVFSSARLSFGAQKVGGLSATQTITLSNPGDLPLAISAIYLTGNYARAGGSCPTSFPATLAVGASCSVEAQFAPRRLGWRPGGLLVRSDAPGGLHGVPLSGTGVIPALGFGPTSLSFPTQVVGTTSPTRTISLTNPGNAPLLIQSIATSGDFRVVSTSCAQSYPAAVAPGAACSVVVDFTPTAGGGRSGALLIGGDVPGGPYGVRLMGAGLAPSLSVDATGLSFGGQQTSLSSTPRTITLANRGDATLTISATTLAGEAFSRTGGTCPTSLPATMAPGVSCTITVAFSPAQAQAYSGTLSLLSDDPAGAQSVALDGVGTAGPSPSPLVAPAAVVFDEQMLPAAAQTRSVTISNQGGAPLSISGIGLSGAGFSIGGGSCGSLPVTLDTGARCTAELNLAAAAAGAYSGTLTVISDAPGGPQVVPLRGAVLDSPSTLAIGGAEIGAAAETVTVRLTVTRGAPTGGAAAGAYTITADREASSSDLVVASGSVSFGPGETSTSVSVSLNRLALYGARALVVSLDDPLGGKDPGTAVTRSLELPPDGYSYYAPFAWR